MITIKRKPDFKRQFYEKEAWSRSELVCGIDEVGRSCFAGPVVAAAAILRPNAKHKFLKDSKLLTHEQRVIAYKWLTKNSVFGVGIINNRIIDKINIYHATLQAMKRATMQLLCIAPIKPSIILVDAMPLSIGQDSIPVVHFCYGERQSASIAAASIIAKVTRDALMDRMDLLFPDYSFLTNKGYGTKAHRDALEKKDTTILHRHSFLRNLEEHVDLVPELENQLTLL
jgi:ribonuclease HII